MDTKEGMPPHLKEVKKALLDKMIDWMVMAVVTSSDFATEEELKVDIEAAEVAAEVMELKREVMELKRELHNL